MNLLATRHPPSTISKIVAAATSGFVFVITFPKNYRPGPKNSLERRAMQFSTICAKNQALN
jgi:hypothetical protein